MTLILAADFTGELWLLGPDDDAARTVTTAQIATIEQSDRPRWVLVSASALYPAIRRAGVRLDRCIDLTHTEALLLAHAGRHGEAPDLASALARLRGTETTHHRQRPSASSEREPLALFGRDTDDGSTDPASSALLVHDDQQQRISRLTNAGAFKLLTAADSVGALLAVEMTETGLPWDEAIHDALLTDLLGPRPMAGAKPVILIELAAQISDAFDGRSINPDSPAELVAAFARAGIELESTRSWMIKHIDHPAIAPLLKYKELSRIHAANGWNWLHTWVSNGRFRPEYIPAGVVSGRWASRGGGALQIPRRLRGAVVADPGYVLVVADAAQLEPRILAAMSEDPGMMRAAESVDMYASLADEAFGGQRDKAKIGLLGAMYGQVGGGAAAPLQVLRRSYPTALKLLEDAASIGERGGLVRSHLGRTCPPRSQRDPTQPQERARGRFTRNFIIQATAAEWAESLLGLLRRRLFERYSDSAQIVFYQHDEVIVHCVAEHADAVIAEIADSARAATSLLFGDVPVRFPLVGKTVRSYADAK
ncbi:MAG: bifunctional 3'-5' exonuclease/DNA polymerase [Antricoccus sp.]